jgi:hypothetical protein
MTETNVADWLLASDPAIRWQVMRDLTDAPDDQVAAERDRVAREGWGAQLLALQGADGIWRDRDEQADMVTVRALDELRAMGPDPQNPTVQEGVARLRDNEEWLRLLPPGYAFHNRPFFTGETEPCINGRIVAIGAYFGQDVQVIVDRLLGEQMADGGWNCEQENGSVRGSFESTINVLEGLQEYERANGGSAAISEARTRGEAYLLERRLFRRLSTGEAAAERFTQLSFPKGYRYDVLRGLDYFRAGGGAPDSLMDDAFALVASRRGEDGRWLLETPPPDDTVLTFGETVGEPSRWITLRAMRVLRWRDRA